MNITELENRVKEFRELLASRKVIYDRHYKDTIHLLERFEKVNECNITFGDISDNALLMKLCANQQERTQFNNDIALLKHYQDLIDNFGKTNTDTLVKQEINDR